MENASKALLMAGGVLIGILIISLAVYLFADFGSKSASINAQNFQKQLSAFNSKFTSYQNFKDQSAAAGTKESDIWKITIYDIITVKGYALENNEKYENPDEQITVTIDYNSVLNKSDTMLITQYVNKNTGEITKFKCEDNDVKYNQNGKVKSINFNKAD